MIYAKDLKAGDQIVVEAWEGSGYRTVACAEPLPDGRIEVVYLLTTGLEENIESSLVKIYGPDDELELYE